MTRRGPIKRNDPNARMTDTVMTAGVLPDAAIHLELSRLDREQMPWWIEALREAETNIRRLRGQLEAVLTNEDRHCPVCGTAVTGRADQVYCGAACRQRARRART